MQVLGPGPKQSDLKCGPSLKNLHVTKISNESNGDGPESLAVQTVVGGLSPAASPENLLELQNFRLYPRPTENQSLNLTGSVVILVHVKV